MRRTLLLAACLLLAPATASARVDAGGSPTAAPAPTPVFTVSGHGWGHGVGMGQYGALGLAQHGVGYARILAHYYPGTSLAPAPIKVVRVLLAQGKAKLTIASAADFRVTDGEGKSHALAAGSHTFDSKLRLKIDIADEPQALPGPLVFAPGSAPLELGKRYRGRIRVSVAKGKLDAIGVVGLEAYLGGVVPAEMPYRWPAEALKAQAVAARSYALSHLHGGAFDVYDDVRSQVYLGLDTEKPSTNAAVQATAGRVLTYGGRVAATFFFSSSGGRTISSADAWGEPIPYLVSVPDPSDSISPYHDWGPIALPGDKLAKALRAPGRLLDVQTTTNPSGRVASVLALGSGGESTTAGADARRKLDLRSTWFTVGVVSLTPPASAPPLVYGSRTRLRGLARNVQGVTLEQRTATASAWTRAATVSPARGGALAVSVRPSLTTSYRLAVGLQRTAPVRVAVAPLVRLSADPSLTSLHGVIRPVLPGARVDLQRLAGSEWRTAATTRVDAQGSFAATLELQTGRYRARVTAGRGYVPGTTAPLEVIPE